MTWCKACDGFIFSATPHVCPPAWNVWREDETPEDGHEVRAHDEEDAIERWAKWSDADGDYSIVGGSNATVFVLRVGTEVAPRKFGVWGEPVPQYHVKEVT